MIEKRFINIGNDIFQDREWWCSAKGRRCAEVIATALNELIVENKGLKEENRELKEKMNLINKDLTTIMLLLLNDNIVSELTDYELKAFERLSKI